MKPAQLVGVVVGIALMAAPALGDYAGSTASDLHRIVGPVAASLALIAAWDATRGVRWPNVVLGALLLLSPLVLDHPASAMAVGLVSGLLLVAATPFAGTPRHHFADGWWGLFDAHDHGGRERRTT